MEILYNDLVTRDERVKGSIFLRRLYSRRGVFTDVNRLAPRGFGAATPMPRPAGFTPRPPARRDSAVDPVRRPSPSAPIREGFTSGLVGGFGFGSCSGLWARVSFGGLRSSG